MRFLRRHPLIIPCLAIMMIAMAMTQQASAAIIPNARTKYEIRSTLNLRAVRLARRKARLAQQNERSLHAAARAREWTDASKADVFRIVNEVRQKEGLAPFTYNRTLEKSAQDYAEHMEATHCFSHTECGSVLKERMHASGYYAGGNKSYAYGENIARGQDSPEEVMEDWMNSPSHKEAILSSKYLEIGVGKSGEFWVQHFGAVR